MVPFSELFEAVTPFLREVTEALPQAPDVQATLSQEALSHPPIPAPERIEIPSPAISQTDLWDLVNEQPGVGAAQEAQETLPQVPDQQEAEEASHHYVERERRTGGESFYQIYLRLLCEYRGKGALPNDNFFFEKAQSIFDRKGQILFKMEELEPGRGWLLNGAQFIKTQKGRDYSVSNLTKIVESLERDGHNSPFFAHFSLSKRNHRP
jgi:hypothetical protein